MKKIISKAIALILTICMVAGIPLVSFAQEEGVQAEDVQAENIQAQDTQVVETKTKEAEETISTSSNVSVSVSYTELKCNEPVVFTVSATGLSEDGVHKFRLNDVSRFEGNDLNLVVDPTRLPAYKESNEFSFTFTSSGRYKLSFGVMDFGTSPIFYTSKIIYIEIPESKGISVESKADEIAAQCQKECSTDYDKALWLHDWLLDNCKYDYSYTYCSAEGALLRGTGTCEAYHRAYEMLLARVGISTGRMEGNGHVWTAVKMDGDWYQVDVTWDDTGGTSDTAQHMYFGLTDELTTAVHSEHKVNKDNVSNSLENNYFVKSGMADGWAEKYVNAIQEQLNKNNYAFDINLINKPVQMSYDDTIKNTVIAYVLEKKEWGDRESPILLSVKYENEKFHCEGGKHEHNYNTITTKGEYLRHGVTYMKCEICGRETVHKSAHNGYSTLYAKSIKLSKGNRAFTVKWKKANTTIQKHFTGYQVQYSIKNNMSGAKTVSAGKTSVGKKVKGLKKGKKYYVRVRTYVKTNGTVFYSKWSEKKAVKIL